MKAMHGIVVINQSIDGSLFPAVGSTYYGRIWEETQRDFLDDPVLIGYIKTGWPKSDPRILNIQYIELKSANKAWFLSQICL